MPLDFMAWPSIARLNRPMVVTEKIDGSNAAVIIESLGVVPTEDAAETMVLAEEQSDGYSTLRARQAYIDLQEGDPVAWDGMSEIFEIGSQSRKRLIKPGDDNYGFAKWVFENADGLVDALGAGRHYGEWWGSGVNRNYGLVKGDKRFSLFNVKRYRDIDFKTYGLENVATVPVLYEGLFSIKIIQGLIEELRRCGSLAVLENGQPRFTRPEGVVVYHVAANTLFKVLCENDEIPKSLVR